MPGLMPKIVMDTERAPFSFEYLEGKTGLDIDTLKRLDSPGCNSQRLTSYLETTSAKKQVSHWRLREAVSRKPRTRLSMTSRLSIW